MEVARQLRHHATITISEGFIKTTDHRPTDHRPTSPPTPCHLPTNPPTTYPPTHRPTILILVEIEDQILNMFCIL